MAERRGDFLMAAGAEQADDGISEGCQVLRRVAAFDLALVFTERDVAYPVQTLDAPMGSPMVQQQGGVAASVREAADRVLQLDRD